MGEILGMKSLSYQPLPLALIRLNLCHACQKRYSQVDENALCNLAMVTLTRSRSDSQGCRQHCDENISVDRIEQDLKDGIKPHQGSAVLSAAAGQSFQTMTMAMQRARPMRIMPYMRWG